MKKNDKKLNKDDLEKVTGGAVIPQITTPDNVNGKSPQNNAKGKLLVRKVNETKSEDNEESKVNKLWV